MKAKKKPDIEQQLFDVKIHLGNRLSKQGKEIRDLRVAVHNQVDVHDLLEEMGAINYAMAQWNLMPWWKKIFGKGMSV